MIYPKNFEKKLGFDEIQSLIKGKCLSTLGKELVDKMTFSTKADEINEWMEQIKEFRRIEEEQVEFPLAYFFDCRASLLRIRVENTHLEEDELFDLRRSLGTINDIVNFLGKNEEDIHPGEVAEEDGWKREPKWLYPALHRVSEDIMTFPGLVSRIDQILDKFGHIRDTASAELAQIRRELRKAEGTVSKTLYNILRAAQAQGVVEKDVAPTLRDGRLVIPVVPTMKRRISVLSTMSRQRVRRSLSNQPRWWRPTTASANWSRMSATRLSAFFLNLPRMCALIPARFCKAMICWHR